jgi:hypothetical protein
MRFWSQSLAAPLLVPFGARSTLDFTSLDDHSRLPWRFQARQLALLGAA